MATVVMHNMTVETRRSSYLGDGSGGYSALYCEFEDETDVVLLPLIASNATWSIDQHHVADDIKVSALHRKLTNHTLCHLA